MKANCYTDMPIGDLDSHTYELRTVRVGDVGRSAGVTAIRHRADRRGHDPREPRRGVLGHQTAAMARNAATEVFTGTLSNRRGSSRSRVPPRPTGLSITVTTPGGVPIQLLAQSNGGDVTNLAGDQVIRGRLHIKRDATVIETTGPGNWVPSGDFLKTDIQCLAIESPAAGTYTYALFYSVDDQLGDAEQSVRTAS